MFTIIRAINMLIDLSWASGFHSVSAYLRSRNSQAMWERFTSSALPVRLGTGSFSGWVPPPTRPGNETSENLSKKSVNFCEPLLFRPQATPRFYLTAVEKNLHGTAWRRGYCCTVYKCFCYMQTLTSNMLLPWKPDV